VPVVFDHFGNLQAALGVNQPGFDALVALVRSGKAYVKVSAAYLASKRPRYEDVAPFAKALIAANQDRVLWGTIWPHPNTPLPAGRTAMEITPGRQIDDGMMINLFAEWATDAGV